VIREFSLQKKHVSELVKGDLVYMTLGTRVPADVRIVQESDLRVEASSLTGESEPVPLQTEVTTQRATDGHNVAFMSSLVLSGEGYGIVIRTGDDTMIGSIASLAGETTLTKSTLQHEVERFALIIAIVAIVTGILFFVIGLARGMNVVDALVNGLITVLIANVPEGLPATVTLQLTISAEKMKNVNVLVKRMDIIETLGSATVIASDKTGTLTQNRMTVENIWMDGHLIPARSHGNILRSDDAAAFSRVSRVSALARQSMVSRRDSSKSLGVADIVGTASRMDKRSMSISVGERLGRTSSVRAAATTAQGAALTATADPEALVVDYPSHTNPHSVSLMRQSIADSMRLGRKSVVDGEGDRLAMLDLTPEEAARAGALGTGDATIGRLSAHPVVAGRGLYLASVSQSRSGPVDWSMFSDLQRIVTIVSVNNKAQVQVSDANEKELKGNATDVGLLRFADDVEDVVAIRSRFPITFEVPFSSKTKFATVVCDAPGNDQGKQILLLKGAPEIVIKMCSHIMMGGKKQPLAPEYEASMMAGYEQCGTLGERVIGMAFAEAPSQSAEQWKKSGGPPATGYTFQGLISLVDPPKDGVLGAVTTCREAGIRCIMVTGDHPLTAEAIARKVGIITLDTRHQVAARAGVSADQIGLTHPGVGAVVLSGSEIEVMKDDETWDLALDKPEVIFARTTPQQKLEIVSHLQRRGEIVVVTGDGVNDSPALKRAQVGVAMGSPEASEVARDAASIILMDDNFASIVNGIREGRMVFDNLTKAVSYTLAHILPELLPVFFNVALGFPIALQGLSILVIDLFTEQTPAVSLAYEPAEAEVMRKPPRDQKKDRLASLSLMVYTYGIAGVWTSFLCLMAYLTVFWWEAVPMEKLLFATSVSRFNYSSELNNDFVGNGRHFSPEHQTSIAESAQAAWFITLVMCQFWHLFAVKTRYVPLFSHAFLPHLRNALSYIGLLIEVLIVCLLVYVDELAAIFSLRQPPGIVWLYSLGFPLFIYPWTDFVRRKNLANPDSLWNFFIW
jgi:magnesium-transporting ATPase (P-type)